MPCFLTPVKLSLNRSLRQLPCFFCLTADVDLQTTHGCGDLVFSSHTIFALTGMMTYNEYGTHLATKVALARPTGLFIIQYNSLTLASLDQGIMLLSILRACRPL